MPKPGRKRKPAALSLVEGSHKRKIRNPVTPKVEIPTPPPALNRIAKAEWKRVAPILKGLGVLSKLDRSMLAGYCAAYARWYVATRELKTPADHYMTTQTKYRQVSVWVTIQSKAAKEMRDFASEFGMTPSARAGMELPEPTESELEDILGGS